MNIIIADDNRDKLSKIKDYLETQFDNAIFHECCCRQQALEMFRKFRLGMEEKPHEWILVTDMRMPMYKGERVEFDAGFSLLRQLKARRLEIPAIIISSEVVDDRVAENLYPAYVGSVVYDEYIQFLEIMEILAQI